MQTNGVITAIQKQSGTDGTGQPVYTNNQLDYTLPAAEHDPSDYAVAAMATRGVRLDRVFYIDAAALTSAGITLVPGDRVTFTRHGGAPSSYSIVEQHLRNDGELVELRCGERLEESASS